MNFKSEIYKFLVIEKQKYRMQGKIEEFNNMLKTAFISAINEKEQYDANQYADFMGFDLLITINSKIPEVNTFITDRITEHNQYLINLEKERSNPRKDRSRDTFM